MKFFHGNKCSYENSVLISGSTEVFLGPGSYVPNTFLSQRIICLQFQISGHFRKHWTLYSLCSQAKHEELVNVNSKFSGYKLQSMDPNFTSVLNSCKSERRTFLSLNAGKKLAMYSLVSSLRETF